VVVVLVHQVIQILQSLTPTEEWVVLESRCPKRLGIHYQLLFLEQTVEDWEHLDLMVDSIWLEEVMLVVIPLLLIQELREIVLQVVVVLVEINLHLIMLEERQPSQTLEEVEVVYPQQIIALQVVWVVLVSSLSLTPHKFKEGSSLLFL
jgi:energy-converting hydrogenase Eha subunit A